MTVDRYQWLKSVYADGRFPAGEKAVLAYVSVFSVFGGEDSFRVRQSTLADAAHSGISRQTVGSALRRAKRHGYLDVASPHSPGRTHHTAETLQLLLPPKSKEALHDSDEEPAGAAKSKASLHDSDPESCKANGGNGVKQTAESCKAANSPTSENDTPNSSSYRSSEGSGAASHGERNGHQPNVSPLAPHPENLSVKDHAPDGAGLDEEPLPDWAIPPLPCPKGGNCQDNCHHCGAQRRWNSPEARAKRQDANYRQAHIRWNQLQAQARAGLYGDWRPDKPPLNRRDFDPNVPWEQPNPPPEAVLSVKVIGQW